MGKRKRQKKSKLRKKNFVVGGQNIEAGTKQLIQIDAGRLYDSTSLSIPVHVIRGHLDGPTVFITAAVHGDEILGIEIIRRLMQSRFLRVLRGNLILIPIANVYGFNIRSRYLPDRRDLNRCFPGSEGGTLASRLAYQILHEALLNADYGIDLHTAAIHRSNLPQLRVDFSDKRAFEFAQNFGLPLILNAPLRSGSLREAAAQHGIPVVTFEAGEALRMEESFVRACLEAIFQAMASLDMIDFSGREKSPQSFLAKSSFWVRAPRAGLLDIRKKLGAKVNEGDRVAVVRNPIGTESESVRSKESGIVIGLSRIPLVNRGDAVMHIATGKELDTVFADLDDYFDRLELG